MTYIDWSGREQEDTEMANMLENVNCSCGGTNYPTIHADDCSYYKIQETCPYMDFVTSGSCVRENNHEPFHQLANGIVFGIGYTAEDAREWDADARS